jgi:hypothetical protein
MDEPIWSWLFARRVAETLGFTFPGAVSETDGIPLSIEAEQILHEVTEGFRYLPPEKIQEALDFADFLQAKIDGCSIHASLRQKGREGAFAEVRDLVVFLRNRYGAEQPADEKDYWTDEDMQEATIASLRYAEETMPYDWGETATDECAKNREDDRHA